MHEVKYRDVIPTMPQLLLQALSWHHSLLSLPISTMMMLGELMNFDALFTEFMAVTEDPFPLITESCVRKHSLLHDYVSPSESPLKRMLYDYDSPSEPPLKRMRTSSSRRITCKARGLSNDHNSDNAYLEITADAPHGLLLSCSHKECTDSDRRFRYCKGKKFVNVLLFCNARDKATHRCLFFIKQFAMYQSQGETSSSDMDTDWSNLPSSWQGKSTRPVALSSTLLPSIYY